MNTNTTFQKSILLSLALATLLFIGNSHAQDNNDQSETIKSVFTVWKDGSFNRTVIEKTTNYDRYKKLVFLPLRYETLEIDTGSDTNLARNWKDFIEQDMQAIENKFRDVVEKEFLKETDPTLTETPGSDVLYVAMELLRLEPKSYRDSSLNTIGSESFETVGFLDYQIILMDSTGTYVVGLIEDHIKVSLWRSAKNIRGNHYRAWSRTFEHIVSRFKNDFKKLKKQTATK